ncbi:glycosyltransferase family 2 protein [archaeon]|nr:MAG: glycosyltransferase family 2 protein [archaeon]
MKSIVIIPVYAEQFIEIVLKNFRKGLVDEICLVVDAPDRKILNTISKSKPNIPTKIIKNKHRRGIGYAIKQGYKYALSKGFDTIVVMAGNGKDDPSEIPRLLKKISEGYDYVQGSRFMQGGKSFNLPLGRYILMKLLTKAWHSTGFKGTDVMNGFRAYKAGLLKDSHIDINQKWLDGYSLEYYIHYKAISLGYKVTEVPVSKTYRTKTNYSKVSHRQWGQIVWPLVMLKLGMKN